MKVLRWLRGLLITLLYWDRSARVYVDMKESEDNGW